MYNAPYLRQNNSVSRVMLKVMLALLPGLAAYVWQFGIGILIQLLIASVVALVCEAAMLRVRNKPISRYLLDGSALVTAWLIALSFPSIGPWWMVALGTAIAIIVAKHLYGGLGQNVFNPAMVAYAVMIVSFPALMSQWPAPHLSGAEQWQLILGNERVLDAISSATPLDALRTGLHSGHGTVSTVTHGHAAFGWLGGQGWEWIILGYAIGGLWLMQQRVITWHIPCALLAGAAAVAGLLWGIDSAHYAAPWFHLASGGIMLGAFFIATDPVSGATTPRGKLIFGAAIGALIVVIRTWGAYPDGVAFAVLLLNICVPLIDMYTQPPVFGHKKD